MTFHSQPFSWPRKESPGIIDTASTLLHAVCFVVAWRQHLSTSRGPIPPAGIRSGSLRSLRLSAWSKDISFDSFDVLISVHAD